MTCPLAYTDPCSECSFFGNCSPSQAVEKLVKLENMVEELKKMLQSHIDNK